MRIAVCGSAGSLPKAPFKDSNFENWIGGRTLPPGVTHAQVEGDWQIWACSPGAWALAPRIDRFFEVHRWEPGAPWFSPEYCQFLRDFKGPVYTGGLIPEIKNAVLYPIDRIEAKFSSYFLSSSLSLMMALAIDEIETSREAGADADDDVIGLWGVDMAATEEYGYQRPGCQFFVLEALRRGIGIYLPPESDLMRPMPVYGLSEWDHNYIKLTSRSRELNTSLQEKAKAKMEAEMNAVAVQGELHALDYFVKTWTNPYGMAHGMVIRQAPGSGLGGGVVQLDLRPIENKIHVLAPDVSPKRNKKGNGAAAETPTA